MQGHEEAARRVYSTNKRPGDALKARGSQGATLRGLQAARGPHTGSQGAIHGEPGGHTEGHTGSQGATRREPGDHTEGLTGSQRAALRDPQGELGAGETQEQEGEERDLRRGEDPTSWRLAEETKWVFIAHVISAAASGSEPGRGCRPSRPRCTGSGNSRLRSFPAAFSL